MSYSTGTSNYIGVPYPKNVTTSNQIGSFGSVLTASVAPDGTSSSTTIANPTKRFKYAYIDEVNTSDVNVYNNELVSDKKASILDSVPSRIAITRPAAKGISAGIQVKSMTWPSSNQTLLFGSNLSETITKYIPELKTWFSVSTNAAASNNVIFSKSGCTKWTTGGSIPHQSLGNSGDFCYSKRKNILLLTLDSTSVTGTGGLPTYYSTDQGLTWTQCIFPSAQCTNQMSYHLCTYIDEWGAFFLFGNRCTTNQQSLGFYPIMKSYDGISFSAPEQPLPSVILAFNSTAQRSIYAYDFDPSRQIMAFGIRNTIIDATGVYYTTDGINFKASNTHEINIRSDPTYMKNGTVLPGNNYFEVNHSTAGSVVIIVTPGNYSGPGLASAIQSLFLGWGVTMTCTHNSADGTFTFNFGAATATLKFLSAGAPSYTMWKELGFTFNDFGPASIITSTVGFAVSRGFMYYLAYSPPLDLWVTVQANTTSILSPNISWSSDITSNNNSTTSPGFWYQPALVKQYGGTQPTPQFYHIKWIDSLQMFLLINQSPASDTRDRTLWWSADGMNYYSTENSSAPKLTITAGETAGIRTIEFDDDRKVMVINDGTAISGVNNIITLPALYRDTSISLPSWQFGIFTSPSIVNGVNTWTVTFDKPFTVAPSGVILSPYAPSTSSANYLQWFVNNITTTGFNIVATNGAAGAGSVITWSWMAWEKVL